MLRARLPCNANRLARSLATPSKTLTLSSNAFSRPSRASLPVELIVLSLRPFASRPKRSKGRKHAQPEVNVIPKYVDSLLQLRHALDTAQIPDIIAAYQDVRATVPLGGDDVSQISEVLLTTLRQQKGARTSPDLVSLAETLVKDIRSRKLPPSHGAHVRLLAYFKETRQFEEGHEFWTWLAQQDDTYVNAAMYALAIEMLAIQGKPASDTEHLYYEALKRFPGAFNEYHLSPNAILPDRTQPFNVKGVPLTLLQAIMTARLLRGDSQNAYLALDTALRLYPSQLSSHFFTIFIEERPTAEAYKVFLMACRSGTSLGADALKSLLAKLRLSASKSASAKEAALRSMLIASYAHTVAGNSLTSSHLTELIIAVTSAIYDPGVQAWSTSKSSTDNVLAIIKKLFHIWTGLGISPSLAAFNSIIANVGGKGHRKDVLATCLTDMQGLGIEPNAVTRRSLLTAAGELGEKRLLETAWDDLIASRELSGVSLDISDWQTLARACKKMGEEAFALRELERFSQEVNSHTQASITGLLQGDWKPRSPATAASADAATSKLLDTLLADVIYMDENLQSESPTVFLTLPLYMSFTAPELTCAGQEHHLQEIYNDMSTHSRAGLADFQTSPGIDIGAEVEDLGQDKQTSLSPTGIPLALLRYENWKTMNEILALAERHDSAYIRAVDESVRTGSAPPKRDDVWGVPELGDNVFGLSDLPTSVSEAPQRVDGSTIPPKELIRNAITRLRAM